MQLSWTIRISISITDARDYDQTHVFNFNAVYDLPFGKGKYFLTDHGGAVDRLVGGWQLGGILRINTGTPLTIVDPRGTLNRVGRSANQTAVTGLTNAQIDNLVGIFNQNGNVYYINPSVINSDGRGAAAFGQPTFAGEVFFDNGPGQFGTLARSTINGPMFSELDMSLTKTIRINEKMRFQIRADAFNVMNHTNFLTGILTPGLGVSGTSNTVFNVNSPTFGQITSANTIGGSGLNRVIQVAGRFDFLDHNHYSCERRAATRSEVSPSLLVQHVITRPFTWGEQPELSVPI